MFKDLFPAGTTFTNDNQGDFRASTSSVGGRFGTGIGNVSHGAIGEIPVASLPSPLCLEGQTTVYYYTSASINFAPLCYTSFLTQPYFMRVDASVIVRLESFVSRSCIGIWRWDATGTFPLESTCISDPKRHCDPSYTDPFRFLDLPLEVTADGETTSLGDYDSESTDPHSYMPLRDTAASIGESIRDALTATLSITSRASCQTVDCSCGQGLGGVSLRLNGETFTVGNEPNPSRGSEQQAWYYTDSLSSPYIDYTVYDNNFLEIPYFVRAEIFCDSEQQAGGNVGPFEKDAWYCIVTSICTEYEDGNSNVIVAQTINTYVGEYQCYEHCEKFLPSGTPLQMYLVSSVTAPGLDSCSPLAATPIIIDLVDCP
jgi:hypothetical protein